MMIAYTPEDLRALADLVEEGKVEVLRGTGPYTTAMMIVCRPRDTVPIGHSPRGRRRRLVNGSE